MLPAKKIIADGAYESIERSETLSAAGVTPVMPPPARAVVRGDERTKADMIRERQTDPGQRHLCVPQKKI
jgi:hypothetical protein